ncbi:uncharacterized protein MAM_07469 [Metarhizium album ARSEF 1941]|uniref:Uncharacterized protein n=1 Tax=Metarhizium album (strain ARSEF 1941) TaxID=1081103 RepID=A0A0B2WM31_METAS|nr:uncharacterized protein MAM_07469 [Metarhizium album ARSEF 1941]KHN94714.1 hypothetical protein MAM_07469 [Metarhizium album ARSEF 1941]
MQVRQHAAVRSQLLGARRLRVAHNHPDRLSPQGLAGGRQKRHRQESSSAGLGTARPVPGRHPAHPLGLSQPLQLALLRGAHLLREPPPLAKKLLLRERHLGLALALPVALHPHGEPLLARGVVFLGRGTQLHAAVHGAVLGTARKRHGQRAAEGARGKRFSPAVKRALLAPRCEEEEKGLGSRQGVSRGHAGALVRGATSVGGHGCRPASPRRDGGPRVQGPFAAQTVEVAPRSWAGLMDGDVCAGSQISFDVSFDRTTGFGNRRLHRGEAGSIRATATATAFLFRSALAPTADVDNQGF